MPHSKKKEIKGFIDNFMILTEMFSNLTTTTTTIKMRSEPQNHKHNFVYTVSYRFIDFKFNLMKKGLLL